MKMTKKLFIVGAGAFGREILSWIDFNIPLWRSYQFSGFISDDSTSLDAYPQYTPGIMFTTDSYQPAENHSLIMGIGDPKAKMLVAKKLEDRGSKFIEFIHPSVLLGRHLEIGRGTVICPRVIVSCHAKIGDFVSVNLGSTVGHDVEIGSGSTLSAHVDLTGFSRLGACVFMGSHASVLPRARIGDNARVGAGSVVLRSVPPGATYMGVPAKQVLP